MNGTFQQEKNNPENDSCVQHMHLALPIDLYLDGKSLQHNLEEKDDIYTK